MDSRIDMFFSNPRNCGHPVRYRGKIRNEAQPLLNVVGLLMGRQGEFTKMLGRQWKIQLLKQRCKTAKVLWFRRTNICVGAVFSRSFFGWLVRSWRSWRSEPFASKKKEADENIQMFLLELWGLKNLIVGTLWLLLLLWFGVWSLTKLPRSSCGFLASPRRAYAHRLVHLPAALGYIVDRHEISKKLRGGANSQQPKNEIKVHQQKQTVCFHHFSKKKLVTKLVRKKSLRVFVPKNCFETISTAGRVDGVHVSQYGRHLGQKGEDFRIWFQEAWRLGEGWITC